MSSQINLLDEISVDLFSGGGGLSTGYELATGRPMTIAINHNPAAVLMHRANHPFTEHYREDVFLVDPKTACRGRPVGFLWASPDCRHFSKAKGKPLVDKKIRGLAWVVLRWAMDVRPRVLMMENVEEFQSWGPLIYAGKDKYGKDQYMPDPDHAGETFQAFIGMLSIGVPADCPALDEACEFLKIPRDGEEVLRLIHGLGYDLDFRELVAADYGAPTTRKRFVLVARCDGRPIVWPERTHAPRNSEEVKCGRCKPWVSAAEIIDWSIPCPSIFETREEIMAKYGVDSRRPLADNTQRRAIRGVDKYTIKSGNPFIVECNHSGDGHIHSIDEPYKTITAKHTGGVCAPLLAPLTVTNTSNSVGAPADQPVHTVTSAGNQMLVTPVLAQIGQTGGGDRIRDVREPAPTTVSKAEACLVAPHLSQYHDEQGGDFVRAQGLDGPINTVDASNRYAVVTAQITEYYGNGAPLDVADPMHTATSHDREALTTAIMQPFHAGGYKGKGNSPEEPVNTVTSSGGQSLVCSHVAEFKGQDIGQRADKPLRTVTAQGGEFGVVSVRTVKYAPGADLGYWPQIRALLNKHCGYQLADDEILLIWIHGVWYYIRDIGLRMLTPPELYRAMGFPEDYRIDRDYLGRDYPKTQQVARCGNAVCPPMARAVVAANMPEWCVIDISTMAQLMEVVAG